MNPVGTNALNPTASAYSWWRDLLLLTLIIAILFGTFLGNRSLATPDEARYSEIPREMVTTHDYTTPHLNYIKYFEKPVLFYWLQAGTIHIFGLQERSLRLMTALLGLIGCLMTYTAGRKIYDRLTGWLASLILATSALYFALARFVTTDMALAVFLSGCLFCFLIGTRETSSKKRKHYFWAMYAFSALATLTKGLVGVIFPGAIIFIYLLTFNEWRNLKTYYLLSGTLLWLLIVLPWHIGVQIKNPEFFRFYFIDQQFSRYLTDSANRNQPLWYLPLTFIVGLFPWIVFLPQSLKFSWPDSWQARFQAKDSLFLLIWIVFIYVFFQISHSQLPPYLLPIFPPLALLIAHYLAHAWKKRQQMGVWGGLVAISIIAALTLNISAIVIPKLHLQMPESAYRYLGFSALLLVSTLIAAMVTYWRSSFKTTFIVFTTGIGLFLISLNLSHALLEQKSIKPLALKINTLLQPTDQIISYHGYYQDLPFYIQRRVVIVGWGNQELDFGMQHQNMEQWLISDDTLWKNWQKQNRLFMIMSHSTYNTLHETAKQPLYLLAETPRDVLVTNQSLKP